MSTRADWIVSVLLKHKYLLCHNLHKFGYCLQILWRNWLFVLAVQFQSCIQIPWYILKHPSITNIQAPIRLWRIIDELFNLQANKHHEFQLSVPSLMSSLYCAIYMDTSKLHTCNVASILHMHACSLRKYEAALPPSWLPWQPQIHILWHQQNPTCHHPDSSCGPGPTQLCSSLLDKQQTEWCLEQQQASGSSTLCLPHLDTHQVH